MARVNGSFAGLALAGAVLVQASAAHAERLYWTDTLPTTRILSARGDGSDVTTVIANAVERPARIQLDSAGGKMYWLDQYSGFIQRASLDGSHVEDLVSTIFQGQVEGTAPTLDPAGGKMYWTEIFRGVHRANLDGSDVEFLFHRTGWLIGSERLAVDPGAGKLYWADAERIQRANLDGSGREVLVVTEGGPVAGDITLELTGGKIYWSVHGAAKIQRANLDGSGVETLVPGHRSEAPIALDLTHGKMFWTEVYNIRRANLDGSTVEDVVTSPQLPFPFGVAVDPAGGRIYWIEQFPSFMTPYKIRRASLDGSAVQDVVAEGLRLPDLLALNPPDGKVYWADLDRREIHRADFDGGRREAVVRRRLANVTVLAADPPAGTIYWAGMGAIFRANRDGSEVEPVVTTGTRSVLAMSVDPVAGKLYWTLAPTSPGNGGTIRRSDRDGSNVQDLVTTASQSEGLALDLAGRKMYFTDGGNVRRANLNGSAVTDLIVGALAYGPIVVDPVVGKMYWAVGPTATGSRAIMRANLDGSQVEIARPFTTPFTMAIDPFAHAIYFQSLGGEFGGTPSVFRVDAFGTREVASLMGAGDALAFEVPLASMAGAGFALNAPGDGLDSFVRVLEGLPAAVTVGPVGSSQAVVKDLDVDPTSGRIYTIDFMPDGKGQQVFVVDPVTGAGTPLPNRTGLAAPSLIWGLAFDNAGTLYGGGLGTFVIDKNTGMATPLAGLDQVPALILGMAASPTGSGFLSSGLLLAPGSSIPFLARHGADGAFVPGTVLPVADPKGRVLFDIAFSASGFLYGNAWPAGLLQSPGSTAPSGPPLSPDQVLAASRASKPQDLEAEARRTIGRVLEARAEAPARSDLVLVNRTTLEGEPAATLTTGAPLPALLLGLGRTIVNPD
jgi:hypothetical protein